MKIKLVVFSEDMQYVEHLVNYLNIHYSDTVELNVFDEEEAWRNIWIVIKQILFF